MAKKQFIRHLEFYGFPDQNGYASDINGGNVDLSEIKKKNEEQDKEIEDLEGEKADKKDLDELSGTVESLITLQSEINQSVANTISGITTDIDELKNLGTEFAQQLSAVTDGVNDALCGVQNLNDRVNDIEEDIANLNNKVDTLSGETFEVISGLTDDLNEFKQEAADTYAKKDDVYTKQEIDDKLSEELGDYASKEWLSENYFDKETSDARYATKEELNSLSERLDGDISDLNNKISTVSGDLSTYKMITDAKFGTLETNFAVLSGATDRKINAISGTVQQQGERITQNANDIDTLEAEVVKKADKTSLEALQNTVSNLASTVAGKVGQAEFEEYKGLVNSKFNDMDEKKADKTAITEVYEAIDAVDQKIDQEIADRISGDTYIQNQITNINNEIIEIKEQGVDYGDRIETLESGLTQEIVDRKQADLDLIGTSDDTYADDTINGAKAFAKKMKDNAVSSAKTYTDEEVAALEGRFDQKFEAIDMSLTAKADITYVDNTKNELKTELLAEIENEINEEKADRLIEDTNIWTAVRANTQAISGNTYQIDYNSDRIDAITSWPGTDPNEYDDSGTGILDVLHREFHKFSTSVGAIKDVRIEDGMLIITYITTFGEKTISTPITDIFDPNAYYNKEQTDAFLTEKADTTALTQAIDDLVDGAPSQHNTLGKISDYLTANTQNILDIKETLSAHTADIEQNTADIAQNKADIATNASAIADHTTQIAEIAADIAQNTADISQNKADIVKNASAITAAEEAIAENTEKITENTEKIGENSSAITTAEEAIAENTSAITEVQNAIDELSSGATEIEQKLETKADKAAVEAELATKPSIQEVNTALAGKVDRSTFDDAMALKADQETMTTMLNQKVDKTTYNSEIASIWAELERLKNIIENH